MKYVQQCLDFIIPDKITSIIESEKYFDADGKVIKGVKSFVTSSKLKDKQEFLKLYSSGVKALFDLSKAAQQVIQVVLQVAQEKENKDCCQITLNFNYAKTLGFAQSSSTFSRGINELIEKDILNEISHPIYNYNLNLFFNGDRVAFIQEFILKNK